MAETAARSQQLPQRTHIYQNHALDSLRGTLSPCATMTSWSQPRTRQAPPGCRYCRQSHFFGTGVARASL
jgi:hypothetical protein